MGEGGNEGGKYSRGQSRLSLGTDRQTDGRTCSPLSVAPVTGPSKCVPYQSARGQNAR